VTPCCTRSETGFGILAKFRSRIHVDL
jgi:hypothetical protein